MYASDFRAIARDALRGRWLVAVITAFIAGIIGAQISGGSGGSVSISDSSKDLSELSQYLNPDVYGMISALLGGAVVMSVIMLIVKLVLGGVGKLGYARFNLNLIDGDGRAATFADLFSQFDRWVDGFLMSLLTGLYIFFWLLLFVIPGIIKTLSYAMTPYILYERRDLSANEAITESRRIMDGNKFRLFCLNLSFIGWSLLCAVPSVIGGVVLATGGSIVLVAIFAIITVIASVFLQAYIEAAHAAFYREVSADAVCSCPNCENI